MRERLAECCGVGQSPGPPFGREAFFRQGAGRLCLVRAGAIEGQEGKLLGRTNDTLSTLGQVQAQKAAELLMDVPVSHLLVTLLPSPAQSLCIWYSIPVRSILPLVSHALCCCVAVMSHTILMLHNLCFMAVIWADQVMLWQVDVVVTSPLPRAMETARPVADLQALAGNAKPPIEVEDLLTDRDWGALQGRLAQQVAVCPF